MLILPNNDPSSSISPDSKSQDYPVASAVDKRAPRTEAAVSDFSSADYWSNRFTKETTFEWLLPSAKIIPLVLECVGTVQSRTSKEGKGSLPSVGSDICESGSREIKGLHIGCGTSSLGQDVEEALREVREGIEVDVVDADYVAESINPISIPVPSEPKTDSELESNRRQRDRRRRRILSLDCLDLVDLRDKSPEGGWDFILDKSTADAISCGPLIHYPAYQSNDPISISNEPLEPLDVLLRNLAVVTRKGGIWISVSYSPSRFSGLELQAAGWEVVDKRFLASTSLPEGRKVRDPNGEERVVWEPETGVWGWVLRRTGVMSKEVDQIETQ